MVSQPIGRGGPACPPGADTWSAPTEETHMHCRRISGLVLLVLGLAAAAPGAERATLADAAEQRDKARVHMLLHTGVDVNVAQSDGTTALHWAAYHDDAETAALLVRAGAKVNAVNRYGLPPLSVACSNG